jgi:hypothetical protein
VKQVNQKFSISVNFSQAFNLIAEKMGCSPIQTEVVKAIGLRDGDFVNRRRRGTAAQYIIDWGAEHGLTTEDLFPELKRLQGPEISAGGVAFYPPMLEGGRQDWMACGPSWLTAMGADQESLRIYPLKEQRLWRPSYGLMQGQWLIFDISVTSVTGQGVYLIRLEKGGPPLVRVLIFSLGGVEIEGALDELENHPLPDGAEVAGKAVGLGALL